MDNDAEMHERMGDHTTELQVKHRECDQPERSKTMASTKRRLSLGILLLLFCCSTAHAGRALISASWACVCSDPNCQACDEGPCCSDACTIENGNNGNPCVAFECTGNAGCGLPSGFVGSPCFVTSRFQIGYSPADTCTTACGPPCTTSSVCGPPDLCGIDDTIDIQGNKLTWGKPATSFGSSSVTAHGVSNSNTMDFSLTDLAKLVTVNGTIFGGTGIGHATLRITSEQVPGTNPPTSCTSTSQSCYRCHDLKLDDCNTQGSQSVTLKAVFYDTPNDTGTKEGDADFLCFPELNTELLCDSLNAELKALCPPECMDNHLNCPKCLMMFENTSVDSGAFLKGVLISASSSPPKARNTGTEDWRTFDPSNSVIVPVLVADPFGDVRLAPFWQVAIDALPDACPNFLQLRNAAAGSPSIESVVEVAAFGTDDLDVHDIDPDRVRGIVPGTGEAVAPIAIDFADIGAPAASDLECACGSSVPDGKTDMVLRFPAAAWLEAWKGTSQLGNQISVSFRRLSDNAAAETADCVTLGVCPEADTVAPTVALTAPTGTQELPIHVNFTAADADGLDGDVVAERILLDGCPVLDGDLVGDRDGILSAEEATIDTKALCGVARACPRNNFKRPLLTVEAVDCNGNTGTSTVQLKSKFHVDGNICKDFGNWHDDQDDRH